MRPGVRVQHSPSKESRSYSPARKRPFAPGFDSNLTRYAPGAGGDAFGFAGAAEQAVARRGRRTHEVSGASDSESAIGRIFAGLEENHPHRGRRFTIYKWHGVIGVSSVNGRLGLCVASVCRRVGPSTRSASSPRAGQTGGRNALHRSAATPKLGGQAR